MKLLLGNCLEQMKSLPENSVDAIVTDPPYGLSFMGKNWDYDVPTEEIWREALRVLKPGGHLLSFFGTRTYHRGVVRIEDAGFEIRDQIMWIYGSGFPKSHNISKSIDKQNGTKGEEYIDQEFLRRNPDSGQSEKGIINKGHYDGLNAAKRFKAGCDQAKQWQGWGTALKPANEPIVVARKPLEKGLTVAENVLKYGTGAINVDGCRITIDKPIKTIQGGKKIEGKWYGETQKEKRNDVFENTQGRWPANIIFDEVTGCAEWSRFFYVAKASKSERDGSIHPTMKPLKLMQYLIKLVTPPNGTVLDPFMGSGSTGVAAKNLGFNFIGCEMNEEYFEIAKRRIESILI